MNHRPGRELERYWASITPPPELDAADQARRIRWALEQLEVGDQAAARIVLCDLAEELEAAA